MNPKVSIIILVYNNYIDTKECLESLANITYQNYEVILVDNGSTDGSGKKLEQEYPEHTYIFNEDNLGFAGGVNCGIRYSMTKNADYVFLLNNDAIVDKGFLEPLVSIAGKNSSIGIVGSKIYYYSRPRIINFAGGKIDLWRGITPHIGSGELDRGQYEKPTEEDFQDGCAMLIKKEVINKIGLFDTIYFLYSEEVDFCYRAKKAGYKILNVPQSRVWHKISASVGGGESFNAIYHGTKSRIIFMRKNSQLYHWLVFVPYCFFYSSRLIIIWLIKYKWSAEFTTRFRAMVKALKDGLTCRLYNCTQSAEGG